MPTRTSSRPSGSTRASLQRITQLESQLASAAAERQRREEETAELSVKHVELTEMRAQAIAQGETLSAEAAALRAAMSELDARLRVAAP